MLTDAERRAINLLDEHRAELDGLTALLLEHETVDGAQVYELLRMRVPGGDRSPLTSALRSSKEHDAELFVVAKNERSQR